MHPLDPILTPHSVAVVGASQNPTKRGYRAVQSLMQSGFTGPIYPVNPKGGELLGLPVAPSLEGLDAAPDLAFICTPAASVPEVLESCGATGVKGAVVAAVGFRESGEDGATLEAQIADVVRRTGIRLVGPNTSGVLNTTTGMNLVGVDVPAGGLALISQSGNVALDVMNEAGRRGCGMSIYVGVGNETDVGFHEYLEYLEAHDPTRAILMYVEGLRDGRKFMDVARRVALEKPIVLLKGGRSERGIAAARSHTGALVGSYPVLRAALRQGGVSEVQRSDELLSVGITLSEQPPVPIGTDIVVLSDGGGHGTLAADAVAALGVPLAALSDDTKGRLIGLLGRAASVENPVDVAGATDRNPSVLADAVEVLAADRGVGGVFLVGLFGGYAARFADELAEAESEAAEGIAGIMRNHAKPLVVHSLYAGNGSAPLHRLAVAGVPVVASLEVGARCMRAAHARGLHLGQEPVSPARPAPRRAQPPSIVAARRERRTALLESEVRELLAEYDVPLVPATLCRTEQEVVEIARDNGRPLALKVVSPSVPHKTEAGGIALRVKGVRAARRAFQRVLRSASNYAVSRGLAPDVRGVLVTPMFDEPLAELIVGVRHDADFGPVLTVGAGGVAVEVHKDTSLRGLPIGRSEVLEMLDEIRISTLLNGYRGRPAANREVLADLVLGVAACALAHPEIDELEVNPVFAYTDRAVAMDARAFLKDLTSPVRTLGDAPEDEAVAV